MDSINPNKPPDPRDIKKRMRASMGLPEPEEPAPEYEPSPIMVGSTAELLGTKKAAAILAQPMKNSQEFSELFDLADSNTLDELRAALRGKVDDGPSADEFWDVARQTMEQIRDEHRRVEEKRRKQEIIDAGAAVTESGSAPTILSKDAAAKELNDILAGAHGSPSTPENKKRRAALKVMLR